MKIRSLKIRPIASIVLLIMVTVFCKPAFVEGESIVWTDKDIYNQGEVIRVNFTNAPGNYNDWICIVPADSPDTDGGDWKHIPSGMRKGVFIFNPPSPGEYEVRAYYNYYRNGYVVSGRYVFSVLSDSVEANLPPPIPFDAPPEVIVIPDTSDVYVVPNIDIDLFFWSGWWWRPWGGHWYRSHYYNRGWGYYNGIPSFYFDVDPGWRGYYRDRNWYGHRWNYELIPHNRLQQNWKSWQNDRHWEGRGTWGVQNYQPRPQQQRQALRQQRQLQYQRRPEFQQRERQPQVLQQRPQVDQQRRPELQQRERQPQVLQQRLQVDQQRRPEFQQRERQPQVLQQRPQVDQQRRPEFQQRERQPQVLQQRPQVDQQRRPELQQRERQPQVLQQRPQVDQQRRPEFQQRERKPQGRQKGQHQD